MQPRILVPLFASLMLSATAALAQTPPPVPPQGGEHHMMRMEFNKGDMEKHRAEFCADRYAHAVGEIAYLQTKLALTDKQKPLFDRWQKIKLEAVKTHSGECAEIKLPGPDGSVIDKLKLEERMLKEHLADLQAQMPALEALVGALNAEQQKELEHAAMHMRHERGEMMEHMRGMGEHMRGMFMHHEGPDGHDGPPPPPPAQ